MKKTIRKTIKLLTISVCMLVFFSSTTLSDMFSAGDGSMKEENVQVFKNTFPQVAPVKTDPPPGQPLPRNQSESIKVFVGKCDAVNSFLPKVDHFLSKHHDFALSMLVMESKGGILPEGLKGRELNYAGEEEAASLNVTRVPTTVITKEGQIYKIVGDVDISDYTTMKMGQKTARFVTLGEEGFSCPAKPVASRPLKELRSENVQPPSAKLPQVYTPAVALPRASESRKFQADVPVLSSVPPAKLVVFSQKDLAWAESLLAKGYQGCCTDCGAFSHDVGACSDQMLTRLSVRAVPAVVDINFSEGKASVQEGR